MSGERQTNENVPGGGRSGEHIDMSVEAQARRLGWYPKDKFHGHPDDWISAEKFVERSYNELPVLKENLRRLDERYAAEQQRTTTLLGQVSKLNERLEGIGEAFDAMRDLSSKAEQRGYDRALAALKTKAAKAAEDGDAEAVAAAMDEATELVANRVKDEPAPTTKGKDDDKGGNKRQPPKQTTTQQQVDPVAEAWSRSAEREWYRTNRGMHGFANGVFEDLHGDPQTASLSTGEKLARVDRAVRQAFPTYFRSSTNRAANEDRGAAVNEPREPEDRQRGNGRSFDDLPQSAKKQFEITAREIQNRHGKKQGFKPYSKEEFCEQYFGPAQPEE